MVKKLINTALINGLLLFNLFLSALTAYGEEQTLLLKYKALAIETKNERPVVGLTLSAADINKDNRNEIVVSGNGYMRIFDWNGKIFEARWKSPQYSYLLGVGNASLAKISGLVPASYYLNGQLETDYIYFGYTAAKSSDIYKIIWNKNNYELQKKSAAPFNWFKLGGNCGDGSSLIIGSKQHEKGNYIIAYKWNGAELVEKWQGVFGGEIKASGTMPSSTNKSGSVFLVQDKQKIGILSCNIDSVESKDVDRIPGAIDLWNNNRVGYGKSLLGFTRKSAYADLWSIQYSDNDREYNAKLYVSQFDQKTFSLFSRVYFKGIDSDMIFNMIITDVDNDGVGEILGVEERIRKKIPRKRQPGDTGEEGDTLLITSNLFLAKWNGMEYVVKWHGKAVDEKVRNIAVGDVTGDSHKEILVTDDNGYLYVFDMPADK